MFGSDIDSIIKQLKSSDARRHEKAFDRLKKTTRKGLSEKSACRALRASVDDYPPPKYEWQDSSAALVWAAAKRPYPCLIPLIRELYSLMNDGARGAALALLAQLEDEDAARTYIQLLHDYNWPARTYPAMVLPFQRNPRHVEILFPKLVEISVGSPGEMLAFETCLSYCQAGMIADDLTHDILRPLLDAYHIRRNKIAPHQQKEGTSWIWEDEYLDSRYDAGLLLDLMGYFSTDEVRSVLREAMNYRDPRLKCIAITSLIHQDADVSTSQLEEAAASAEMRIFLYERLQELQRLDLYPQKYLTQEDFAEADMVNWLCFPTELGRAPNEIELMKVVSVDTRTPDGIIDYFVFRFRTDPPHWSSESGWMAGISGPFLHRDAPSPTSYGDTFSTFDTWDSKTADEHLGDIQDLMERWREHHADRKNDT